MHRVASPVKSSKPKMVPRSVQFVGLDRSRSVSSIKIQKVIRGFLVRKNVKKIMSIKDQVNDMERRVSKSETLDLIRKDSKERLKVNEILMRLLLKLDSVKGVDSCVRDLRKSVITKAIALQELVDAIVSGDQITMNSGNGSVAVSTNDEKERMVERIMEDNEKMMRMMETLLERNKTQTRLLSGLTQWVERLEKAFLSEDLRRKRRRSADEETSQDIRKSARKR